MTGPAPDRAIGLDPTGTAGGLAAITGIASVGWAFFDGLTAALAALALLGWLVGRRGPSPLWTGRSGRATVAGVAALGWGLFLTLPGPWEVARGVALGLTAGIVGWIGRRRPPFGGAG